MIGLEQFYRLLLSLSYPFSLLFTQFTFVLNVNVQVCRLIHSNVFQQLDLKFKNYKTTLRAHLFVFIAYDDVPVRGAWGGIWPK